MVGHRHGAVLLVVRAFVHPGVSMRPMEKEIIGAGTGVITRAPSE
jgi:hypothetical protein